MNIFCEHFEIDAFKVFIQNLPKGTNVCLVTFQSLDPKLSNETKNEYTANEISRGFFFKNDPWVLDENDLIHYEKSKGLFINILARFAYTPDVFSAEEMAEHYLKLINFWTNKVRNLKPDAIFEGYLPHLPSSFALYLVSKYLKIPYIFLEYGPAYKIKFFSCSYRNRMLLAKYSNGSEKKREINISDYINELKYDKNLGAIPEVLNLIKEENDFFAWNLVKTVRSWFPFSIRDLLKGKLSKLSFYQSAQRLSWLKTSRRSWNNLNSQTCGYFPNLKLTQKISRANKKNKEAYRKLCKDLKEDTKFIYYAAHFMPEGATLPAALEMRHQFPFLKMLSDCLPEDWVIAFKENPLQFKTIDFVSPIYKSEYYYDELSKIPKLTFINETISSSELISKSMGVATINGTIGIEAPFKGKYVFISASNYHENLDGVIRVKTKEDIIRGINLMMAGNPPNPNAEQMGIQNNFFVCENFANPSQNDYIKMSKGFFLALEDFEKLDNRKWDL